MQCFTFNIEQEQKIKQRERKDEERVRSPEIHREHMPNYRLYHRLQVELGTTAEVFWRLRQEDHQFETSLVYVLSSSMKFIELHVSKDHGPQ